MALEQIRKALAANAESWVPGHQRFMFVTDSATMREILAVMDALPKCACGVLATKGDVEPHEFDYCDGCAPAACIDLPYAAALRALLGGG